MSAPRRPGRPTEIAEEVERITLRLDSKTVARARLEAKQKGMTLAAVLRERIERAC